MTEAIRLNYDFRMSKLLSEGRRGKFKLTKKTVSSGTILNLYDRKAGRVFRGKYMFDYPIVTLSDEEHMWMSDSQPEVESVLGAVEAAKGDVLIGGLGIGLLPTFLKDKMQVKRIDIVELHQEVIDLIFNQVASSKMQIIHDDLHHYLASTENRYDFIHIDIWAGIHAPLEEIDNLRFEAERCLKPDGRVWCWLQELYDRIKTNLPRESIQTDELVSFLASRYGLEESQVDRIKANLPKELIQITNKAGIYEPYLICSNTLRNDYTGLCADCADGLSIGELFLE